MVDVGARKRIIREKKNVCLFFYWIARGFFLPSFN